MTAYAEVIGDPIAQSKSPVIHRYWLDRLGMEGDYRRTRVSADELPDFVASRRDDRAWRGCNVTMPLKAAILDLVEDPGELRATIGAANCVIRGEDGQLNATNTDVAGFYEPIAGLSLSGKRVTVVGAGGAARAVLFALARLGVDEVALFNRTPLKAAALLSHFGLKGRVLPLDATPPQSALIVNASSLGMAGQPEWVPDLSGQSDETVVYDLVYHPLETALLSAAAEAGLTTADGLDMLIGQARVAFELLWGRPAPDEEDDALRDLLQA